MKQVKSLFSKLLIAVMMFLVVGQVTKLPVNAEGASDEMVVVYTQIPEDWESPNIWAWNDEGNNAFDAWPGEEMEMDAANEGWYYVFIPSWANHVIINANKGEVQTDEIVLGLGNAWITIKASDDVEVSTDKKTDGDIPEYVEKFAVHAKVDPSWKNPCLWAWSAPDGTNAFDAWPGKAMTEGENGWYTAKAPVFVNSIIINGNDGEVQTEDISIDSAEIWVTVDAEGKYEFSYVDPDKAAVGNITVYVSAPSDWTNPCLWAWSAPDGTNVFTTWPGEELTQGEDGWLSKEVPGWVNSVIVNGNEGTVQTTDISVETGKDLWIVVKGPEDYEVFYEKPEIETKPEKKNAALPIAGGVVGLAAVAGVGAFIAKKKK